MCWNISSLSTLRLVSYLSYCVLTLPMKVINWLIVSGSATGAIAGGVAAGAALLFAAPAIALVMWRRRKPQDHFFDVPG